ncbi:MAG TPA: ribonuclease III [Candidatus Methylacidiphilales bacterium]|nr:ribonuclease III [Candidatus Methylacidiphilales bacterium]
MGESFGNLQERLGHMFADAELLRQALTHASYGHEKRQWTPDNQRLEFLGDAVLQLAVTEELYRRFPEMPEGRLTVQRAQLVNRNHLQALAQELGLGEHLILGRGEENSQGRQRPSILADAMEAVIGAVYAEAGWAAARAIVLRLMEPSLAAIGDEGDAAANPKGCLQEKLQAGGDNPPVYRCVGESGPAHARVYEVVVEWQGRELGRGHGASKKEAEIRAAEAALSATHGPADGSN